jgi:hypothetical protein
MKLRHWRTWTWLENAYLNLEDSAPEEVKWCLFDQTDIIDQTLEPMDNLIENELHAISKEFAMVANV